MLKRNLLGIKLLTISLMTAMGILFAPALANAFAPTPLFAADAKSQICQGIGSASGEGGGCTNGGGPSVNLIIKTVVNILSFIAGIAAVIMIIVAGLKYVTSSGDTSNTASAKNTLLYAIVGLIVVALAQIIVRFVIGKVD